jgi:hypothetical protein
MAGPIHKKRRGIGWLIAWFDLCLPLDETWAPYSQSKNLKSFGERTCKPKRTHISNAEEFPENKCGLTQTHAFKPQPWEILHAISLPVSPAPRRRFQTRWFGGEGRVSEASDVIQNHRPF